MKYQSITILTKRLEFFPDTFLYQGVELKVKSVERTRTTEKQLSFIVKVENSTGDKSMYELVQTLKTDTWTGKKLERS